MTKNSILKLAGAFHCVKTSRIRFCAFSYSAGEPCGRSFQVIMYFMGSPLPAFEYRLALLKKRCNALLLVLRREADGEQIDLPTQAFVEVGAGSEFYGRCGELKCNGSCLRDLLGEFHRLCLELIG